MVNYACGFNQSEVGNYFQRIVICITHTVKNNDKEASLNSVHLHVHVAVQKVMFFLNALAPIVYIYHNLHCTYS